MKHRGWIGLAFGFRACAWRLTLATSTALAQQDQQDVARERPRSAARAGPRSGRKSSRTRSRRTRTVPLPVQPNRAGRACGDRSAYSRAAGASGALICYPQDIPDSEIARYRERLQ